MALQLVGSYSSAISACNATFAGLGAAKVAFKTSINYQDGIDGARNEFNRVQAPACVIYPASTNDVSLAMTNIFRHGANYAVQSGGHTGMVGWNNVEDGVLISFRDMNSVSYNPSAEVATVQPGARWNQTLLALNEYGVAVSGGRMGDVGVGGLLTGGGYSHLSPQIGHSTDMIREIDIVLVNGTTITANGENEHRDLLKAVKGGGSRFGIITRFQLDVVKTGTKDEKNWYGGLIEYNGNQSQALLTATANYVRDIVDPNASILVILGNVRLDSTYSLASIYLVYAGSSFPDGLFDEFLSIPATSTQLGPLSYYDVAILAGAGTDRVGTAYAASALGGDAHFQDYETAFQNMQTFSSIAGPELVFGGLALTPVPQSQIVAGRQKGGGNAIDPPDGNYVAVLLTQTYPDGVDHPSSVVVNAANEWIQTTPRTSGKPVYLNEASAEQNAFSTYGQYAWLKKTYAKYDPTRFNVRHSKGPIGL